MVVNVSVLLNSYSHGQFVQGAIDSVLAQRTSYTFELIILNANPALGRDSFVRGIGSGTNIPFRIVNVPRGPVGRGMAMALESCEGKTIALIDDDDLWEPSKIQAIGRAFERPGVVYFHNGQTLVDSQNNPLPWWSLHSLVRHPSSLRREGKTIFVDSRDPLSLARIRALEPDFNNSSASIRRDLLTSHFESLKSVDRGEDGFLYYCALASGGTLAITTDRLTRYRIHSGGVTAATESGQSPTGRLETYIKFAEQQYKRFRIVREDFVRDAAPAVRSQLDIDLAFWITMMSAARGNSETGPTLAQIRELLGSQDVRPRGKDMIACAVGLVALCSPRAAQFGLRTWRGRW